MTEPPSRLAAALLVDLREIAVDVAAGGYTRASVAMLERNLRRCVPSALGATITVVHHTIPASGPQGSPQTVEVHLVAERVVPATIRAALRVPLFEGPTSTRGWVTFYAGQEWAFGELAADLTVSLGVDPTLLDLDPPLPDGPIEPGLVGLVDFTVVNMALGCLLNRGRSFVQAQAELAQHADRLDTDLASAARLLLNSSMY